MCTLNSADRGCGGDLGAILTGSMHKKETPGVGGIEDGRADGLAVPSGLLPAWGYVEYRQAGVVTGKNRQLPRMIVELFGEIAQADSGRGDIAQGGSGKEAAVCDMYGDVIKRDAWMAPLIGTARPLSIRCSGAAHHRTWIAGHRTQNPLRPAHQLEECAGDTCGWIDVFGEVHGGCYAQARGLALDDVIACFSVFSIIEEPRGLAKERTRCTCEMVVFTGRVAV